MAIYENFVQNPDFLIFWTNSKFSKLSLNWGFPKILTKMEISENFNHNRDFSKKFSYVGLFPKIWPNLRFF